MSACGNNLKQLGLGVLQHESGKGMFPLANKSWQLQTLRPASGNVQFFGYIPAVLPYIEEQQRYDSLCYEITNNDIAPWSSVTALNTSPVSLLCPSDFQATAKGKKKSYLCNMGDIAVGCYGSATRSPFVSGNDGGSTTAKVRVKDITDGTSKTAILSERALGAGRGSADTNVKTGYAVGVATTQGGKPQLCLDQAASGQLTSPYTSDTVGFRWASREDINNVFYTILAPNGPTCTSQGSSNGYSTDNWALMTVSSYHQGGVNVVMADGSVRFVSNVIDAGDPNQTPIVQSGTINGYKGVSQWGVWGAMGTMKGGETVNVNDF